jgi:hypothetical protein
MNVQAVADKILKTSIKEGVPDKPMGTTDQSPPEDHTEQQLSRLHDTLFYAQEAGLSADKIKEIFKLFPTTMKTEYNYSVWKYKSR